MDETPRPTLDLQRDDVSKERVSRLSRRIMSALPRAGDHLSPVPGLTLFRRDGLCEPTLSLIEPSLSLVVRGQKHVAVGAEAFEYGAGSFALTSVEHPAVAQVLEGDDDYPFCRCCCSSTNR